MAQTPIDIHSQKPTLPAPLAGKGILYTQEKAKKDLLEAIEAQNIRHGGRQKMVQDRYSEKVEKYMKRGNDKAKAEVLASKQIQRVRGKLFKEKLATPGTKQGERYKDIGDSDGEGALFLLKKFVFDKRNTSTEYLSHEDIEKRATSDDMKDANVLKFFIDGGGIPGVTVSPGNAAGLKSARSSTRIVMDHHPDGATSATSMAAQMLSMLHLIPEKQKKTVKKFVQTIDIVDSFLSKAGKAIDVEKDYAKTLIAFSYQLDSEQLYKLCEKLPDDIGALSPVPDDLLTSIDVTMKEKKDPVKLIECVKKKQMTIDTGVTMVNEKIKQQHYVTIGGKKLLIFGPKENISNDVRAVLSAQHNFGTIKVHETGDIFMVHDEGIPHEIRKLGATIRDVIFLLNPKTAKPSYEKNIKPFCDIFPDSPGKEFLLAQLHKEKTEKKPAPMKEVIKETVSETAKTVPSSLPDTHVSASAGVMQAMQSDMHSYGESMKGLRSGFVKRIRRKK